MANFQIIANKLHRDLRCHAEYKKEYGYGVGAIMVLPREIVEVQREYPILFRKHAETGALFPNAMLGFKANENLFLDESGNWNARHIPLAAAKGPFIISIQTDTNGDNIPVVCGDLDDKRFSTDAGERLYTEDGMQTPFFQSVSRILAALHEGSQEIGKMVDAFLDLDLLEPVQLDIEFKNGDKVNLSGAYTIPEEKLLELSADKMFKLNQQGFLGLAHMISASLNNVKKLVDFKNKQL